jgi:hypothetical protein
VEGFGLRFDLLQPLPRTCQNVLLVYGLYEGSGALMPLQTAPLSEVFFELGGDNQGARLSWIHHGRIFKRLPPTADVVCVVEVQAVELDGVSSPVGWTVVPLFDQEHHLMAGAWRLPLLEPPIKFALATPAAHVRGERMDVLEGLARVYVSGPDGVQTQAALYARLRPCAAAPSPDDLDYEQKMAELATRSPNEWPLPLPMAAYKVSNVFRVSTPSFIRPPYTPPQPASLPAHLPMLVQETAGPLSPGGGGGSASHVADGAVSARKPEKKKETDAGGVDSEKFST